MISSSHLFVGLLLLFPSTFPCTIPFSSCCRFSKCVRREIIYEKKEKNRAKNGSLRNTRNTSTGLKEATFAILINYASAYIRKKRLSLSNKAIRKGSQNKFVKKSRCQTESKVVEKSVEARIVRELGLGLSNPSKMTEKDKEFDPK